MHRTRRSIFVVVTLAIASLLAPFALTAAEIQFSVFLHQSPANEAADTPVTLVLVSYDAPTKTPPRRISSRLDQPVTVDLAPGRWVATAEMAGSWGEPVQVVVEPPASPTTPPPTIELPLWPAGRLEGQLVTNDDEPAPAELPVFFRSTGTDAVTESSDTKTVPPGRVLCPVAESRWSCELPAGRLDLRFQSGETIPIFFWGREVPAGDTGRGGTIHLRRGTSVQGWVVTADGSPLPTDVAVRAEPMEASTRASSSEASARLRLRSEATRSDDRGFYQLVGLPPGRVRLIAEADGFAPATTEIDVRPGEIVELTRTPLVLDRPHRLELIVDPPVPSDAATEAASQAPRWRASLARAITGLHAVELVPIDDLAVSAEGTVEFEDLPPGRYSLDIDDPSGETWYTELLEIAGTDEVRWIELDLVEVIGEVFQGDEPLVGELVFGGFHGTPSRTVSTDEDGRFIVLLPHAGDWPIGVVADDPPLRHELPRRPIEKRDDGEPTELRIDIPATHLFGRVVDSRRRPIARALVRVTSEGSSGARTTVSSDEDGRFDLRALAPGSTSLHATARDLISDSRRVEMTEDREVGPVELVMRPVRWLDGIIVSESAEIGGALVTVEPIQAPSLGGHDSRTDASGRFRTSLPSETTEVRVTIAAPGHPLTTRRIRLPEDDETLVLPVASERGTLVLRTADAPTPGWDTPNPLLVSAAGAPFDLLFLENWAEFNGVPRDQNPSHTVVPQMAPGPYLYCLVESYDQYRRFHLTGDTAGMRCTRGTLAAHGELVLSLGD